MNTEFNYYSHPTGSANQVMDALEDMPGHKNNLALIRDLVEEAIEQATIKGMAGYKHDLATASAKDYSVTAHTGETVIVNYKGYQLL